MSNISFIKNELKKQKSIIETKNGSVTMSANNPTPEEITAGISSIPAANFSDTTAEASDVIRGKFFYNVNGQLTSGTLDYSPDLVKYMYLYQITPSTTQTITYSTPTGLTSIRRYAFDQNPHTVNFYFNPELQEIGAYAFYGNTQFRYPNFKDLQNITTIGDNCFYNNYNSGINFSMLPTSLRSLGQRAFQNCVQANSSIVLPPLSAMGNYCFASASRNYLNKFVIPSGFSQAYLPSGGFQYNMFDDDFVLPSNVTIVQNDFNYCGFFHTYTFHSSVEYMYDRCFSGVSSDANSLFTDKWIKFEGETPPYFGVRTFATQMFNNGTKIYVPDTAVDAYKTKAQFTPYANYIHPMSEFED